MKQLKKISVVFMMMLLLAGIFVNKTYAKIDCNVNLSTSKKEVNNGEKFSVSVKVTNLQSSKGIIAIGAILGYDKNSLTLLEIEGQNKWSDPMHNDSTGRLIAVKNEFATKDENVFKITFKVNAKAGKDAWVKINDFEISDGNEEKNVGGKSITIPIKGKNAEVSPETESSTTNKTSNETNTSKNEENSVDQNTIQKDEDEIDSNEDTEQDNSIVGILKDNEDAEKIEEGETTREKEKSWVDYVRYTCEVVIGVGVVGYIVKHIRKPKRRKRR